MGYSVFYSAPDQLLNAKFPAVAHLPCIFDSQPSYHRHGSRYLIDCGLGHWPRQEKARIFTRTPTDHSMKNYADWLANFLEWAERRGVDPLTCDFEKHIAGWYHTDMLSGTWSLSGKSLSNGTIGPRVRIAFSYIQWLVYKGIRQSPSNDILDIKTPRHNVSSYRYSKSGQKKRSIRMPSDDEVKNWLRKLEKKSGYTRRLLCELILLTGIRRTEATCWRIDTLPSNRNDWHLSAPDAPRSHQQVRVTIKFGTKGTSYGNDHGDKIGPRRDIWIPLILAERLSDYMHRIRNVALKKAIKNAGSSKQQAEKIKSMVHLFLDEDSGERITGSQLYNAWTGVELPFKGWSPHGGRDWWACSTLLAELSKHESLARLGINVPVALMESIAMPIIRFTIQPQLGHRQESSTMIYLQWVIDMKCAGLSILYDND